LKTLFFIMLSLILVCLGPVAPFSPLLKSVISFVQAFFVCGLFARAFLAVVAQSVCVCGVRCYRWKNSS
jgi:hypothetical protein